MQQTRLTNNVAALGPLDWPERILSRARKGEVQMLCSAVEACVAVTLQEQKSMEISEICKSLFLGGQFYVFSLFYFVEKATLFPSG